MGNKAEEIERFEREYYEKITGNKANNMVKAGIMKVSENNPKRFIILCEKEYLKMKEYIGPMMAEISREYAKSIAPTYKEITQDKTEAIKLVFATVTSLTGWGVFEFPALNPDGSYTVRIYNSFEADIAKKDNPNNSHSCTFSLGFIKGLFESVFERKVRVEETKCKARGDEYCEFNITLI